MQPVKNKQGKKELSTFKCYVFKINSTSKVILLSFSRISILVCIFFCHEIFIVAANNLTRKNIVFRERIRRKVNFLGSKITAQFCWSLAGQFLFVGDRPILKTDFSSLTATESLRIADVDWIGAGALPPLARQPTPWKEFRLGIQEQTELCWSPKSCRSKRNLLVAVPSGFW